MSRSRYLVITLSFIIFSTVISSRVSAQGLVGYWPFTGNANDASGNGNNGTVNGATLTYDRFGVANRAYNFNGVNAYIQAAHSTLYDFDSTTEFTISAWVKFCTKQPIVGIDPNTGISVMYVRPYIVGQGFTAPFYDNGNHNNRGFSLAVLFGDKPGGEIVLNDTISVLKPRSLTPLDDGRWHLITVVVWDTTVANYLWMNECFVDGQNVTGTPSPNRHHFLGNLYSLVMGRDPNYNVYFKGAIDDIRIYNRKLYPAEIQALYTEGGWPNVTTQQITVTAQSRGATRICPGDSVQLEAQTSGPISGIRWNGAGINDDTSHTPWAHPTRTTTYSLKGYGALPCPDSVSTTITIAVNDPPKLTIANRLLYACPGDVKQLEVDATGTGPFRFEWSPAGTLNDATIQRPVAHPITSMKYVVKVTDANGCSSLDSIAVTMYPTPAVNAGRDTVICRGSSLKLGGTGNSENRYAWSPRAGLSDSTIAQPMAKPDTTTTYAVMVTSPSGCKAYDTVVVRVNPAASVDAGSDAIICSDSSAVIGTVASAGYTYVWQPPNGLSNPATAQPVAKPITTTMYYLTATNASGCSAIDSVMVTVLKPALTVDQGTLNFGELDGCTSSKDLPVVVTNSGTSDLRITDATFNGAGFSIVSPPRPIDLKPGEKVTLTLRYAPTGSGPASSTLTVSGNPCNVTARVDLKGSKEQSLVSADVASMDFGRSLSCAATDSMMTITITNSGGADATIDKTALAAPFSIDTPTLPVTIGAGTTQKITIHYAPTAAGVYSEDLKLPYRSGTCQDTLRITVSGIVEQPELKTDAGTVDFGTLSGCEVGHDTTLTLTNSGTFDITIDSASIPSGYKLVTTPPLVIAAGGSRSITLRFEPQSSGASNGTLALRYSPCDGIVNITLNGTKQGVSFSVPDSLDLGEVFSCREDSKIVSANIIYSGDGGTGSVGSVSISGPFTTTLKAGDVLNNGVATAFDVTFVPTQDGTATGFIDVTLEPCGITRRIELTGSYANIALVPSSISFGTQPVGTSTTRPVLFINNSSVPMRIEKVEGIAPPFSIASTVPTVPATLPPGDTLHIFVSYQATSGTSRDTLQADVTDPCRIVVNSTLEGTGEENATATVSLPIVEAVPGEHVMLPLMLKSSEGLDQLGAHRFTMDVSFNRTLLFPNGSTPLGIEQGHERVVTINGERPAGMSSGELARLEFIVALGDTTFTPVHIESFRWLDAVAQVRTEDGGVTITSQGGWKLFLSDGTLRLLIKPNPANQNAEVDYEVIEPGRTKLLVRDAVGREVQRLLDAEMKPGQYTVQHDVSQLPAGAYFYVLVTPTGRLVMPLIVVH